MLIEVESAKEKELIGRLKKRTDPEAKRLLRFLNMPDLSRQKGSPIAELVKLILEIPSFADFDDIKVPEIAPVNIVFNLFNFPADHPARRRSDTYFVDEDNVLRPHTTIMWYYWLKRPEIKSKIEKMESRGAWSYGKVYRKDEIDREHLPVFHNIDGWWLTPKSEKKITIGNVQGVLIEIARKLFGKEVQHRFNKDEFPYTDPSIEMEIKIGGRWIEILGAGVVSSIVLKNLGVNPDKYNGWAFGSGLERLAMASMDLPDIRLLWSKDPRVTKQMKIGSKFKEVSKYPAIVRDISFVVDKNFVANNYFDLIRDIGGDLVEEAKIIDKYEDAEKFGKDRVSYTYRIVYRSMDRTLLSKEVDIIQNKIYQETAEQFNAQLRR